jgi:hypothetical protein
MVTVQSEENSGKLSFAYFRRKFRFKKKVPAIDDDQDVNRKFSFKRFFTRQPKKPQNIEFSFSSGLGE